MADIEAEAALEAAFGMEEKVDEQEKGSNEVFDSLKGKEVESVGFKEDVEMNDENEEKSGEKKLKEEKRIVGEFQILSTHVAPLIQAISERKDESTLGTAADAFTQRLRYCSELLETIDGADSTEEQLLDTIRELEDSLRVKVNKLKAFEKHLKS
eukprot:CAMPEP_0182441438 /NCGR_PEP_ID=MMETSP1172-20130603/399_1 /TAXON_ID=708627 /ORGANISM="Timspurckia oligopyrenoides, Strain CCMP3278" /LENGTH=154 /DNA_ID=CAMNT_0024635717 /DNA_START=30 /DNA_END=494 /DNA_ORIENTATION=-